MLVQKQEADLHPYYITDVHAPLELSLVSGYRDTHTQPWVTTFEQLYHLIYPRPAASATKEGRGFLIGPCQSTRRDTNMPCAHVAVLDADSSLTPDGKEVAGAPDPTLVHQELVRLGLTHLIYTTYSHGGNKGNRYRVILPTYSRNKIELLATLTCVANWLQHAGLPIALTRESSVWTQLWQLPKVSGELAPYLVHAHYGLSINGFAAAYSQGLLDPQGQPKSTKLPRPTHVDDGELALKDSRPSVIRMFNERFSSLQWLEQFGYTYAGHSVVIGDDGEPGLTYRYAKPGSSSNNDGVVAFQDSRYPMKDGEANWLIYSHHTTDPLCNGLANDSYKVFEILMGQIEKNPHKVQLTAARLVRADIERELNEEYPAVCDGRFRVFQRLERDKVIYYSPMDWNAFTMAKNSEWVPDVERDKEGEDRVKFKRLPDYWKDCAGRTTYVQAVFDPYPITETRSQTLVGTDRKLYFNQFPGWGVTPRKGNWPILREHLFYSICGGIEAEYEYFLNYLAHMVLFPKEKPGVAIVLRGGKGWGKSIITHALVEAFGKNAMVLANNNLLSGRFNNHLSSCLLAVVEESNYPGSHKDQGPLKHIITDKQTTTEPKGVDAKQSESYLRVIMASNDDWVAPASSDERRYFLPTLTAHSYNKDIVNGEKGHFFKPLFNEMMGGGIEAFVYDLTQRKVSLQDLINVPETDGLKEQRAYTLSGVPAWLFKVLRDGRVDLREHTYAWTTAGLTISEREVIEAAGTSVSTFERERNITYSVGKAVKRLLGPAVTTHNGMMHFGPLADCRSAFITSTRVEGHVFDSGAVPLEGFSANITSISSRY